MIVSVKAVRTNHFPGDTFRRIDVKLSDGRTIPAFGVWPRRDYRMGRSYYEGDGGGYWDTMKQVKEAARKKIQTEMGL